MKISLNNIIPFTVARNTLNKLIDKVEGETYFVISKQNKPKAVIIDPEYLSYLQKQARINTLHRLETTIREKFNTFKKNKKVTKVLTEEESYTLLTGENITV